MAVLAPCAALAAQRGRRGRHAEDEQRAHLSSPAAAHQRTGSQLPMRRAMCGDPLTWVVALVDL